MMGLSQNHLSLHSPAWIKAPPAPVGAVPQPQGFLWKVTGSSREHHSAQALLQPAANNLLCSVLKYPGCIPACHSRALLLSSRTPQPALLTAIPGACRSPELLMSSLILHPPTAQSVTAQRSQREAVTPQPRQRGEN